MSPVRKPREEPVRVEVERRETTDPTKHRRLVVLLAELVAARRHSRGE